MRIPLVIITATLLLFESCNTEIVSEAEKEGPGSIDEIHEPQPLPVKNPALIYGSDFLNIFRRFYINQNYDGMLLFTSNETIGKFGRSNLLDFYKNNLKLGFEVKLKSIIYNNDSSKCVLNYEGIIFGTKQIKSINCTIENDSVKISLKNLQSIFLNE